MGEVNTGILGLDVVHKVLKAVQESHHGNIESPVVQ